MKTGLLHARRNALFLAISVATTGFATRVATAQTQAAPVLRETVVNATRIADPVDALPFGVSVISKDDIRRSGVTTVNEAIMKLLGVPGRVDFYGGGDYSLDLRGFGTTASSNQVFVVDGVKINEADTGGTRLAGISIDSVERIEILHGSASVLYGAGATGGVVVITTKAGRGTARKNSATVYTAAGSYGLLEARSSATLVAGGFSLDVGGNSRQSDNHRAYSKSDTSGHNLVGQWSNEWMRVGARYTRDILNTRLPGALTDAQYHANHTQGTTPTKSASINNTQQSIFYEAETGSWQWGVDVASRDKVLDSKTNGVATYQYVVDANTVDLKAKNETTLGRHSNVVTLGVGQADWRRKTLGAFGSVARQDADSYYVQNDFTFARSTRFAAGLRGENVRQKVTATSTVVGNHQNAWDVGVTQPLAADWAVFGRTGTSFRFANVDELGFTTPGAVLAPQVSRDWELGARWFRQGQRAEVRLYRSELNNELGYDPTVANSNSFSGLGANINFDATVRQGLELDTQFTTSKTTTLRVNARVRQSVFATGSHQGLDVPLAPRASMSMSGDWRAAPAHVVNMGVHWVSTQRVDFNNACSIPAYATVDAKYAYQVGKAELSLGITNLADTKYYTQAFTCTAGVTNGIYPEAGRALMAALRMTF